jgi:hypothetical protein
MRKIVIVLFLIFVIVLLFASTKDYYSIAFEKQKQYNPNRKDYVVIIDYSKNILTNRLFVLDMKSKQMVLSTKVSHSFNSGFLTPSDYSNIIGSNKTSKGDYITIGTKYGKFGYSMLLKGLNSGINDNAQKRAIISHSNKKMKTLWSNGCFATSEKDNEKIINLIKNGCLVCVID